MNLQRVEINNYKSISSLNLELNGESTVIFGVNGTGKSTLLSAINSVLGAFLGKLIRPKAALSESFNDDDVTVGASSLSIAAEVLLDEHKYVLSRNHEKSKENSRTKSISYDKNAYNLFINEFRHLYPDDASQAMPVYVYYSTNRAVLSVPDKLSTERYDKLSAIENATMQAVDFKKFFSWYRDRESLDTISMRQAISNGEAVQKDIMLSSVQHAIMSMLDNISDLQIKRDPVRMTVVKDNQEIRVDLLSDGEKCTLALFGDLARRLCLANPNSPNPLSGKGIVLIDEVELHMHPSWQRKILRTLRTVFPNIQFIITTHSPQVLGETDNNVKVFAVDYNKRAFAEVGRLDGADSNLILEKYMQTASINRAMRERGKE